VERLTIAIDEILTADHGPEIYWTWRVLLSGIGWAWEQVQLDSGREIDIAYVLDAESAPAARLCIQADSKAWMCPGALRLDSVSSTSGLPMVRYKGYPPPSGVTRASNGQSLSLHDIVFDVFWLVTGQEERHWPQDQHGFYDLTDSPISAELLNRQALASEIERWVEELLSEAGLRPPIHRWPNGRRAAAIVGHDVDYPLVKRWLEPIRLLSRRGRGGLGPAFGVLAGRHTHWNFENWIALEDQLNIRSTFYFCARKGSVLEYALGVPDPFYGVGSKPFRRLFRRLHDAGFEIGLHSSYLAYQDLDKFVGEKAHLEDACEQEISGNTHHYWHLNPVDPEETLLMHEAAGLRYSISLVHDRYVGWRRCLSHPFYPYHEGERRELATLQIPLGWMDDQLFGRRRFNPGDRWTVLETLVDTVVRQRGCLVADVHNYVFDDILYPGWVELFRTLWGYLVDRSDFWFATARQAEEHWRLRHESVLSRSIGLEARI
jgi:hypothetical protein